ncbi:MAG: 1,4-dihydroxy-6-naphthoate synthase [Bacteroidetes bacterium]|nr:1,4-dihydroxy-6-naphthoate synthase [Bacteroidota bacterium]
MVSLAFSPCPNDTFIFDAMVHGKIDTEGLSFDFRMEDVETLNHLAMEGAVDMVKVSYHGYLCIADKYLLLDSGSALGRGNGPLLISKKHHSVSELKDLLVAIPGEYTTAHLLLKVMAPGISRKKIMVFHQIEDAILKEEVDAGVIIHENRFTYQRKGLLKIADLGEYWENLTGLPVPLGGIVARKELGEEITGKLNRIMHRSVAYAMKNPEAVMDFVRQKAQEMEDEVMQKHIALYVNDFTLDLGEEGRKAVEKLIELTKPILEQGLHG